MAYAFRDGELRESPPRADDLAADGWLIIRRGSPALADVHALLTSGVPARHWRRDGDRLFARTPEERAAIDAEIAERKTAAVARRTAAAAELAAVADEIAQLPPAARTRSERILLALRALGVIP